MAKLCEKRICFDFYDKRWEHVVKFDEHPDYKKIEKLNNSKAVDFLSISNRDICFIEIKDFKNYRIENKPRLRQGGNELMTEVAIKVKDSLACIVAANRNSTNDRKMWSKAVDILSNINKNIIVILWLEQDKDKEWRKLNSKRLKLRKFDYKKTLEEKLSWLLPTKSNIQILNQQDFNQKELQATFQFKVDFKTT